MNLREELRRGINAYGFEKPSAIQQRAIVPCVRGHDIIMQVRTMYFDLQYRRTKKNVFFFTHYLLLGSI